MRAALRVTPGARRTAVDGTGLESGGRKFLKVSVTAAPEGGKANAAVVKLLAKEWRVAKSRITVVSGATGRRKTLHVAGEPKALLTALRAWLENRDG